MSDPIAATDLPPEIPPARKKKISESKRRRDVFRYCPKELRGFNLSALLEKSPGLPIPPPGFVPSPSKDPALTAFAQLGALRLGAARALISLLDGHNQYILAEATPTLALRSDRRVVASNQLWLGNVRIPRSSGVCERVLELNTQDHAASIRPLAVIIDDLAENEQLCKRSYVEGGPKWRFYAGVPMFSPDGAVIGALCIFDNKPRDGLSPESLAVLHDLAATVVEHLKTYKLREENRRGERMVRGLTSFLARATSLQQTKPSPILGPESPDTINGDEDPLLDRSGMTKASPEERSTGPTLYSEPGPSGANPLPDLSTSVRVDRRPEPAGDTGPKVKAPIRPPAQAREQSASSILQDSILPLNAKDMFSRAANIIRETSELDGVVIFDASIAGVGGQRQKAPSSAREVTGSLLRDDAPRSFLTEFRHHHRKSSGSYETSSSDSSGSSSHKDRQRCQILGFSCAGQSSIAGDTADIGLQSLTEHDLKKMLKIYSRGKIMNFGLTEATTSSDESARDDRSDDETTVVPGRSRKSESMRRIMDVMKIVAPAARSLCFLPLWDYERSRWFVGCLFWTNQNDRLLSPALDLVYLKAFGNSIMTELSRLHAIASNKTKTTFAASISHELRSPLHGILGGIEFLQGTNLDAFQSSMLHSTIICGKTLLDTLNHVMDYAKINEVNSNAKSYTQVMKSNSVRVSSRPMRNRRSKDISNLSSTFDLSIVTEEVVEAVFASQSYRASHHRMDEDHSVEVLTTRTNLPKSALSSVGQQPDRKLVHVILDIPREENWKFSMPVGAWRRILMNLLGNALKYTKTGYIKVSLKQLKEETKPTVKRQGETKVVLTVSDTGIGMSSDFLANHLYSPFSQENSFSSGVGLGLNIVRQIVESVSGSIDLTSDIGVGTEVAVTLSLPNPNEPTQSNDESEVVLLAARKRMSGQRVCVLHNLATLEETSPSSSGMGSSSFASALVDTLEKWLSASVFVTSDTNEVYGADIVICAEPSFESLASIRFHRPKDGKAPMVIFLTIDAIEAAALRTDVRVTSKESVVEIVSQPCGPYKLARVLDQCLTRYGSDGENTTAISHSFSTPWDGNSQPTNLPIRPENVANTIDSSPANVLPNETVNGYKPNILIVDDNAINRRLLIALMEKHEFHYREAVNGLDALQIYQTSGETRQFDVVLMDLSMPIMDGMTATSKIRKYEREKDMQRTTIIALTGLVSANAKLEAMESGIDHYLTKPVKFGKLMELLLPGSFGR